MAFKPPDEFDFKNPSAWTLWKQRFVRFMHVSKIAKELQVDSLLYSMGPKAENILLQLNLSDDESKDIKTVHVSMNISYL
jgi:hypothetical protein